jgi:hypothetical protein
MKKVFVIDSEPVPSAPMGRFLPRDIVVKLYPESNIQRLKYIFKYNTPQELPEGEAIELLKRFPSVSLVDDTGKETVVDDYERLPEFKLSGDEGRKDLALIMKRLLLKMPAPPAKSEVIIDIINGQIAIGKNPLTDEGMKAYEEDLRVEAEKRREKRSQELREHSLKILHGKEAEDVNVS